MLTRPARTAHDVWFRHHSRLRHGTKLCVHSQLEDTRTALPTREIMKWTYIEAVCHRPMCVDPLAWLAWHAMPAGLSGWTTCSAARLCLAGGCFPKGKGRG